MPTPLYVIQELARIRESAAITMLDRSRVKQLVVNPRAAEWLDKASESQYIEALNDMGKADSDEFLDDSPRQPRPSDEDDFGGVELDPISGLPEYLFRNDEDYDDEEEDDESAF